MNDHDEYRSQPASNPQADHSAPTEKPLPDIFGSSVSETDARGMLEAIGYLRPRNGQA